MRTHVSKILSLTLIVAAACGGTQPSAPETTAAAAKPLASEVAPVRAGLTMKLTSVYVEDQDKALRFYTDVLGLAKKTDISKGRFRWLTVASPADPDGIELQLALNDNPAAKAYQQAMAQQGQPAIMFFTNDVTADYERIKARGAEFTMPPTAVTGSTIATLKDNCGNLIQLTQLN